MLECVISKALVDHNCNQSNCINIGVLNSTENILQKELYILKKKQTVERYLVNSRSELCFNLNKTHYILSLVPGTF